MIIFDLQKKSNRGKNRKETVAEYLSRRMAICEYLYIMGAVVPNNLSFQYHFTHFYGLKRLSKSKICNYYNVFLCYSQKNVSAYTYKDILESLQSNLIGTGRKEKSFGSKMLHTLKPDEPIIDSIVLKNLQNDPTATPYFNGEAKSLSQIADIIKLHDALKNCYENYLIPYAKDVGYFDEFDKAFPAAASISEVKKIDFYLWAM